MRARWRKPTRWGIVRILTLVCGGAALGLLGGSPAVLTTSAAAEPTTSTLAVEQLHVSGTALRGR